MSKFDKIKTTVLITGASGFIGQALFSFLQAQGYSVYSLSRSVHLTSPYWDKQQQKIQLNGAPNPDIIIHLAGLNIAQSRWSNKVKSALVESRIRLTQHLVNHINHSPTPPSLFICASAIGFYGETGAHIADEQSPQGTLFISQLAAQWEQTSQQITQPSTRVVNLRTGIVLGAKQGVLAKMLVPFKMGLGGRLGSGKQMMSWIDLQDELNAILFIIKEQQLTGPVNLVSPNAVSNDTFVKTLAHVVKRPCLLPLPTLMVKLLLAEMGEELLLASTHVTPTKLLQAGFKFECSTLEKSLKKQLT